MHETHHPILLVQARVAGGQDQAMEVALCLTAGRSANPEGAARGRDNIVPCTSPSAWPSGLRGIEGIEIEVEHTAEPYWKTTTMRSAT